MNSSSDWQMNVKKLKICLIMKVVKSVEERMVMSIKQSEKTGKMSATINYCKVRCAEQKSKVN